MPGVMNDLCAQLCAGFDVNLMGRKRLAKDF